jgi:hypothetical protein
MMSSPQRPFRPHFMLPYHGRKPLQFSSWLAQINHD